MRMVGISMRARRHLDLPLGPTGYSTWAFEQTAVMSTYLLCIVAGEYVTYTDTYADHLPLSACNDVILVSCVIESHV